MFTCFSIISVYFVSEWLLLKMLPQSEERIFPYMIPCGLWQKASHMLFRSWGLVKVPAHKSDNSLIRMINHNVNPAKTGRISPALAQRRGSVYDAHPTLSQRRAIFPPPQLGVRLCAGVDWHAPRCRLIARRLFDNLRTGQSYCARPGRLPLRGLLAGHGYAVRWLRDMTRATIER